MKRALVALASVLIVTLLGAVVLLLSLRAALAPLPGEWSVPLRLGPLETRAGVASMLRLATSPWAGPLLDGRSFPTRAGIARFAWDEATRTLAVGCAPCTLPLPALGARPVRLADVRVRIRRQFETLSGDFSVGGVHGTWEGRMTQGDLRLSLAVAETPLAEGYRLFADSIPELDHAQVGGVFSLKAKLTLPSGEFSIAPHLQGMTVDGLDVGALANARSSCSPRGRRGRLTPESWIARAVIAAEDQRFYEHPGYDLAELAESLQRNQDAGRIERGGSTLSQQVAKLLVTGEERSVARKLRELLYAVAMEQSLGKARILQLYLLNAPWGSNLCGADAAARHYFDVPAHQLTPPQAAWLAAMLHNPPVEAKRWGETGQINLARAQWVMLAMRGLPRARKVTLAEEMAATDWTARWARPVGVD